jgi:hypothetical protein
MKVDMVAVSLSVTVTLMSDSDRNVTNLPNYDVAVYPLYRV